MFNGEMGCESEMKSDGDGGGGDDDCDGDGCENDHDCDCDCDHESGYENASVNRHDVVDWHCAHDKHDHDYRFVHNHGDPHDEGQCSHVRNDQLVHSYNIHCSQRLNDVAHPSHHVQSPQ